MNNLIINDVDSTLLFDHTDCVTVWFTLDQQAGMIPVVSVKLRRENLRENISRIWEFFTLQYTVYTNLPFVENDFRSWLNGYGFPWKGGGFPLQSDAFPLQGYEFPLHDNFA